MSDTTSSTDGLTGTGTGGDSLSVDFNSQFDLANMVWILTSSALVWIMIPGVGLLYSGLARKKHSISLLWSSIMCASLISFHWFFWGYSLAFSHTGGKYIGNLDNFALMNVLGAPAVVSSMPDILFMVYQGMFAGITGMIMVGGAHERARLGPMMLYLFIWLTIVYCPIACWTWSPNGWLADLGDLDYAGGGPVHMASGAGALAYALVCGKRNDPTADNKGLPIFKPHSVTSVVFGTIFLWFGWFGFNGGSTGNGTIRAAYAFANTNLAAGCGALAWLFLDYFRYEKRWTTIGMCSGAIAGLVGITPAAGFVPIYFAVPIGVLTSITCNYATGLKHLLRIDDGLDAFALHGVGGFVGSVLTGLFAADYIAALDGTEIDGGWLNHHYIQLGYQLAAAVTTVAYAFGVSCFILFIQNKIPYVALRLDSEKEEIGTDQTVIGEYDDHYDWTQGTIQGSLSDQDLTPIGGNGNSGTNSPTPEKAV